MMDSFIGLQSFSGYYNIPTVGEEYPEVPFSKPSTVSVAAVLAANQAFSGSPQNG